MEVRYTGTRYIGVCLLGLIRCSISVDETITTNPLSSYFHDGEMLYAVCLHNFDVMIMFHCPYVHYILSPASNPRKSDVEGQSIHYGLSGEVYLICNA